MSDRALSLEPLGNSNPRRDRSFNRIGDTRLAELP